MSSERPSRTCKAREYKRESRSPSPPPPPPSSPRHNPRCNFVTELVTEPTDPSMMPTWQIRSTWQLASVLNFFNVFRPLLKINVEFSAEELERALISPNTTLGDIHMPLMRAIPPNTRNAIGQNTWITVLCRKLRDWWYWVAEGELPIVAGRGSEIEAYNALDPVVRVLILKALCDIRVEQEDIRNHIDNSIKAGVHLFTFRKERVGGDSYGISYWYEDDPVIGHRLYRETRKVELEKEKGKNVPPVPALSYQWETVATNLDEFQDVSEKLFVSKNRTEVSLGKKLKTQMLPEIEKVHKNKEKLELIQRKNIEKLLKKQHRQALLLGSTINMGVFGSGRSRRDKKHVSYTFDDYERSINEAIIKEQNQLLPEPSIKKELSEKPGASVTIRWTRSVQAPPKASLGTSSSKSVDYGNTCMDPNQELLVCSNDLREEPVEAPSDYEDAVGKVMCDGEYLRERKQKRKLWNCFEGDNMHHLNKEYPECDAAENGLGYSSSMIEDSDERLTFRNMQEERMRENNLKSVDELQLGVRNGHKPTRLRVTFKQQKISEPGKESKEPEKR